MKFFTAKLIKAFFPRCPLKKKNTEDKIKKILHILKTRKTNNHLEIVEKKQRHQVVTIQIAVSFTLPPHPEFAGQLQWPVHPN